MTNFGNLDGELDDDFLNIGGETVVGMVATSATQNVYPELNEDLSPFDDYDFSDAAGWTKGTILDKKERARRRAVKEKRKDARQASKNAERTSRAELNKGLVSDKQSDIELAKALGADNSKDSSTAKTPMSTTTKVLIGAGVFVLLAGIGFIVYKKMKK
jgi:hypothetical protein